jgi:hypothetical protein
MIWRNDGDFVNKSYIIRPVRRPGTGILLGWLLLSASPAAAQPVSPNDLGPALDGAAAPLSVEGRGSPHVVLPRLEDSAIIDGHLDEPVWQRAVRLTGFSQYQPVDGRPAHEHTEVLVWYSPSALYLGVVARDRDPGSIRATMADRDRLDQDDSVTIFLDTFNDRRRAFFFTVNPFGIQEDGVQTEGASAGGPRTDVRRRFGTNIDRSPDYQFESRGRLTGAGYVVEMRIPFKSLRYASGAEQRWRLNVLRKVQRSGYEDTWTDVRRSNSSFLAQAGTIELRDLSRGVVTEIQPFVTTAAAGARDAATGRFARQRPDASTGVNARVGLVGFSLDATVNPDFSQVESDAGLVEINERFALFYPEKRPFFLEGIELFAVPNQLVYTRQIADPLVGGKLTGKSGPFGLAYLSAVDRAGGHHAAVNIARVRADLGSASTLGVTFTDRNGEALANRVLAADARVVFARLYYVQGQLGWSSTATGGGDHERAPIWLGEFDRTGRHWGFNYRLNAVGPGFQAASGYVPRTDIVEGRAFNRLTWLGQAGRVVESVTGQMNLTRFWRHAEFGSAAPIEGTDNPHVTVLLRGGWNVRTSFKREFFTYDAAPFQSGGLSSLEWTVTTPVFRALNATVQARNGGAPLFAEAARGRGQQYSASANLRPAQSIRIAAGATAVRLLRERDGSEFGRTMIPRLTVEYQPYRALFVRVTGEHRSERRAALLDASGAPLLRDGVDTRAYDARELRLDALVSYEPRPGTVAFFGYGSSLETDPWDRRRPLGRAVDGFFVKLAYLWRR